MSTPTSAGTFDITTQKKINTAKNVTLNYLPMGLTGLMFDKNNNWITANCSRSSTPNLVYIENGTTTNYYVNKLWIIGKEPGTNYPLPSFTGVSNLNMGQPTAELILQNFTDDREQTAYVCILLYYANEAPPGGQVELILNAVKSLQSNATVDLNADIFRQIDQNATFVQYDSKENGANANVIIYSVAIPITSVAINTLQNNLGLFDMYSSDYNIIPPLEPGSWMECDYVPIDSEEVAAYSLPLNSEVLGMSGNNNNMKTIMLFIVFAVLVGVAYAIIPDTYLFLVGLMLGKGFVGTQTEVNRVFYLDLLLTFVFGVTSVVLICVGAFGNPEKIANTGLLLTVGLTLAIFYTLCYIIIQSKKMSNTFLPGNVNYNITPTVL